MDKIGEIFVLILAAAACIYSVFLLLWYRAVLPGRRRQRLCLCLSAALCTAVFLLSVVFNLYRTGLFLLLGTAMLACRLSFDASALQAFYFSTFYVLSIYSSRGILAAAFSLLKRESIHTVFQNPLHYSLILLFAAFFSILILLLRSSQTSLDNKRELLRSPAQVKFVSVIRFILLIYMMLVDDGRYHGVSFLWFSTMYLLSFALVKILMLFVENHALRASALLSSERNTRQLEQQLARQMRHYQTYQKYVGAFRTLQHDFQHLMTPVRALIRGNEAAKACSLLDEMDAELKKCSVLEHTFSDHIIADAILLDAAEQCEALQIRFQAAMPLPKSVSMADLDLVRLFTNVINNAVEACCKVPVPQRFFQINSACIEGWITIEAVNSYDGLVSSRGEAPPTSKPDRALHGQGLGIVRRIVEAQGGVLLIEADPVKKRFALQIHLPQNGSPAPADSLSGSGAQAAGLPL